MRKTFFFVTAILLIVLSTGNEARAQQYKIRQANNMMSMKTESTIYVKGMRKRTEPGSMMGMPAQPVTIEQCDLQRTIKINDKKKLYFIEPLSKETEEVIDEDAKPVTPAKNKPVAANTTPQTGGIINMWYNITDTGERKKMNGFTARHVWSSQKIKPSADACTMKDSIIIKTDGWYIDLPQFNCPVRYRPAKPPSPNEMPKPDCQDKFVTHRSGKGKLGFPLTETRTIIMGNKGAQTSEFTTALETLEFSTAKLDSMLFEIPLGYKETMNEADLQDRFDMNEMIKQYSNQDPAKMNITTLPTTTVDGQKQEGKIRIGVYKPMGNDQLQADALQKHIVNSLTIGNIEAVEIGSEEDAKNYNCDYTLASDFIKIKSAGKVGGFIKAIKNADPTASSSFNIEAAQTLIKLLDHSIRLQPKINGKFDGKIEEATQKAMQEGCRQVLKEFE